MTKWVVGQANAFLMQMAPLGNQKGARGNQPPVMASDFSRPELEQRRKKGLRMLQAGKSQIEIARQLGVSEAAVSVWKKQIDEDDLRLRSVAA